MLKKNKLFCLSIVSVMAISIILSGCNGKTPVATQKETKPVNLTYYYPGQPQADLSKVQDAMNKILKKKINATITLNMLNSNDYQTKMQIKIASQENFDLCFTSNWLLNYNLNASKGAFADLTTLFPKYAPKTYSQLSPKIWNAADIGGKIYGIINQQIMARQSGIFFPKDWVDKYKFDYKNVKTYADIAPLASAVKAGEPKDQTTELMRYGLSFENYYNVWGWENLGGAGTVKVINNNNPKVFNVFATPEFKDYVMTAENFQAKGYIPADALTGTDWTKADFVMDPASTLQPMSVGYEKATYGKDYYVQPLGKPLLTTGAALSTLTAISATSTNQAKAMQYIELINTDKTLYNLLCHGIAGVDYKKISDTRIENIKGTNYNPSSDWEFGNQFNGLLSGTMADDNWAQTQKINNSATISSIFGFSFDTSNVKTEVANVTAVTSQYEKVFNAGLYTNQTEAKLQEFLSALKNAGNDKIMAEEQKQLDAFMAAKK